MHKILIIITALFIFTGCSNTENFVNIKYRDSDVNIAASYFEEADIIANNLVDGAWYDESNKYMIIKLNGTYYHYCDMPTIAWEGLEGSNDPEDYYDDRIKGNYDCRLGYIPTY